MNRSNRLSLSFAIWVRSGGESLRVVLPVQWADCNSSHGRLFNFYRKGYLHVRESYSAFFDKSLSKVVAWENRISNNSCIWDSCRCVCYKKCYPLYFLCVLETKINILILFYEKVFVFPFRIFNPLVLRTLLLYSLTATPRNATGQGRGRG